MLKKNFQVTLSLELVFFSTKFLGCDYLPQKLSSLIFYPVIHTTQNSELLWSDTWSWLSAEQRGRKTAVQFYNFWFPVTQYSGLPKISVSTLPSEKLINNWLN